MSYMIPVGRPLYEGVTAPKPQESPQPEPQSPVQEVAPVSRGQDQVTLSPEAQAYLNSQKPAAPEQPSAVPAHKPLLDKTI